MFGLWDYFGWPRRRLHIVKRTESRDVMVKMTLCFMGATLCCDPEWKEEAAISFKRIGPDVLTLEGKVDGKQIRGRFRRMDDSRFPLISRGFRWINERPFSR